MIRYQLICDHTHEFESWFRSSEDFDQQQADGLLCCPLCGSQSVKKALMAPSVKTARKNQDRKPGDQPGPNPFSGPLPPSVEEVRSKMREMRDFFTKNSENVGDRFATVARDIHYGDEPERGIHGKAKPEEVKQLIDEGIHILPLPALPEEKN